MSVLTPSAILGPQGRLASLLPGYEHRIQQTTMAELVNQAISERQHAIIEAPTGVGKSLAYLVPLARYARETGNKVVISTATIALQEQLVHKDLPLLREVVPGLNPVLVKGRQNYLSLRRLDYACSGQRAMFEDRDQVAELQDIKRWAAETVDGDRGDMPYTPAPQVWRQVVSDKNNCLGRRCPRYHQCFFYAARRRIEEADILVVNHHLYFADLALREGNAAILPAHEVVVFDEAHALEDIATDHLGVSITEAQVRYFLDGLANSRGHGLLIDHGFDTILPLVETARAANHDFWHEVTSLAALRNESMVQLGDRVLPTELPQALQALMRGINEARGRAEEDNLAQELRAQSERACELAGGLNAIATRNLDHHVYYAEVPANGRGTTRLSAHPLSVAEPLKDLLFDRLPTVILTSATLAADDSDRFLFLRRRLGIGGGLARRLDSPFDFSSQARLMINRTALDPNSPRYEQALAQWLGDFLEDAEGGTFVLFTSYRQLNAVHDLLRPRLDRANRFVLRQGDRMERRQMIELFKQTGDAVLFGTASFWEGVDVRGDALRNVIITKLPFEMPAHPLVEARHQEIRAQGENPFMLRTVPEAILRLKQGIGRLIRTRSDSGIIVICDHRVLTKRYGRYFIRALPEMPTEYFQL